MGGRGSVSVEVVGGHGGVNVLGFSLEITAQNEKLSSSSFIPAWEGGLSLRGRGFSDMPG